MQKLLFIKLVANYQTCLKKVIQIYLLGITRCFSRFMCSMNYFFSEHVFVQLFPALRKKGTETVPLGCYCYKMAPFFLEGCFFSLIIMFVLFSTFFLCENSTLLSMGYQNSTPRGAKLWTAKQHPQGSCFGTLFSE